MRDYQRSKVYAWENAQSWMHKKSYLTEREVVRAVSKLDRIFKKKTGCEIRNGEYYKSYANRFRMVLRREWALSYGVLLHEYAHTIESNDIFSEDGSHGKDFVSIYCCLLHAFHPMQPSFANLAQSCNEHGVEFREFDYWWEKLGLTKRIKPFSHKRYEQQEVA